MSRTIAATYRPQQDEIALYDEDGDRHAASVISVTEARAIHGALGLALRIAECARRPLDAVEGCGQVAR